MRDSMGHMVALTQQECIHINTELSKIKQAADTIVDSSHNVQSQALTVSSASHLSPDYFLGTEYFLEF